jgi:all-trans-8'-apo-beta-carotenal 15,15'-oxygenase
MATTLSRTATAQGSGQADWHRIFESLEDEHSYTVDEIDGRLPEGLVGTLYRNGPGKNEVGGKPYAHLFDGDGLLSQFAFDGKRLHYRNRFVRTTHYLAERAADKPVMRNYGQQRPGGPLGNAFRMPANVANTSVQYHAGSLLALYEGGRPWQLDPDTLETVGEHDYDGKLKSSYTYSAHPTWDPATGELYNFGIQYGPKTRLRTYRIDAQGRLHHLHAINLPFATINHDCALTSRYMVFVIDPVVLRVPRFLLGFASLDKALRFDSSKATQVILAPRDGGKPRIAECEPFFHYHINNAFDDGDDVVLDLVRYPDYDNIHRGFRDARRTGLDDIETTLTRMRVSGSDDVTMDDVWTRRCEFPQHDWRLTSRPHRYTYLAAQADGDADGSAPLNGIVKMDDRDGATRVHSFGRGQVAGEPIFVPRRPDSAEDDGWLLSLVYSAPEHRSRLVVLDARDVESDPVAVAHLRHHIPLGFHGTFTSRVAAP